MTQRAHNYNMEDYSLAELIQLFDLQTSPSELTSEHVERAQQKLQASIIKGKLTLESRAFFTQALSKLKAEVSKKKAKENQKKNDFNVRFNDLFENTTQQKQIEERRKKNTGWFTSEEDPTIEKVGSVDEIHRRMDQMRLQQNRQEREVVPLTISGNTFFEDTEELESSPYITSETFGKTLKYDDIRRVHRDETIIPVKTDQKINTLSLDQYKTQRESKIAFMEQNIVSEMLASQKKQQEETWQRKREKAMQHLDQQEKLFQINYNLLHK